MDRAKLPGISGLVLGTALLSLNSRTSFAFDKPLHTTIIILASVGLCVIGLSRLLKSYVNTSANVQKYTAVPLEDLGQPHASRDPSPAPDDVGYPSSLRKVRIIFLILVFAICWRAELGRRILRNVQCSGMSYEPLIPFIFAFYDFWRYRRHQKRIVTEDDEVVGASVYDAMEEYLTRASYRYLVPASFISFGCLLAMYTTSDPHSTYICAATLRLVRLLPITQHFGTALDLCIIYCIGELLHLKRGRGARGVGTRFISVAWAFLFSALALSLAGVAYYIWVPEDRRWIRTIPSTYFWSVFNLDIVCCSTALCALLSIHHVGIVTTSIVTTFTSVCTLTTSWVWHNRHNFPLTSTGFGYVSICLAILGFAMYFHIESVSEDKRDRATNITFTHEPSWFYLVLLSVFLVRTSLWVGHSSYVSYHPIDMLIFEAQAHHDAYVNQTSSSSTFGEAKKSYLERYKRNPPLGFQHWYDYATARNSVVIDDYDSIHRDLLPFNALSPADIRQRTWDIVSNPWNDVAGLSVRNGSVAISPNVMPTHRWMLDGLVDMIGHFSEFLPDMDIAFNLNDECRVAVPYEEIEPMRELGRTWRLAKNPEESFSGGRADQWAMIPEEPNRETPLREMSFQRTFYDFGSVGCPPRSAARTHRSWDVSRMCTACTSPQSLGAFLANWTVSADICHQPDLANLHGLYLSPAAFKGAHALYPIFSQSKAHGYNDILYPSAWNYIDKAKYGPNEEHPDPPFLEKNNTLFWRGATSEGVSPGSGTWKGMTRQRFIHLANNINNTTPAQTVLLPYPIARSRGKLTYTSLTSRELTDLMSTDVHVVEFIARCGGKDCDDQAAEFAPLVQPSDFQHHWKYKYLLDLDGAGFSGRFLPFLASRSLPFKAALFREWYDNRLTPWQHFVPLDLRGHGFWATLAYFAGLEGKIGGKFIKVEAHDREAERIAERGRAWARKVLRKEDMEIYFFRLLLEWGRLTDDRRDELGIVVT